MEQEIILEARNITKVYPGGVVANHNVNLQIRKGEIHALVGENGAGKSTLMKMLFGMLAPTEGQIFVDGKEVHFSSSSDAIAAGLGMVHQHFMLVPSLTVAENMVLGMAPRKGLFIDHAKAVAITKEYAEKYNLHVEPEAKVMDIPVGMKQKVEILKALVRGAKYDVMARNTADAMRVGAVMGAAAMVDGLIGRYAAVLGKTPRVWLTGDCCQLIAPHLSIGWDRADDLIFEGLRLVWSKNRG